jgi:hypothetical protein
VTSLHLVKQPLPANTLLAPSPLHLFQSSNHLENPLLLTTRPAKFVAIALRLSTHVGLTPRSIASAHLLQSGGVLIREQQRLEKS